MADPRTNDTKLVKTLPQIAEKLGCHRSTLVRLEQRGVIDKAPIVGLPVQGRVYDAALEKIVTRQYDEYKASKGRTDEGRPTAPDNFIVT